jgi:opacity protein-like surface antigen
MKLVISTLAATVFSMTAFAADLPRRTVAPAPVFTQAPLTGFYAGINGGVAFNDNFDNRDATVGGTVGYEFNRFLRGEVNVSNRFGTDNGQSVTADAVLGVPVGRFTPYTFVGVGYGFNGSGKTNGDAAALWSVGGGVRYELTRNWEVDARYRYTRQFSDTNADNNAATLGLNYRF